MHKVVNERVGRLQLTGCVRPVTASDFQVVYHFMILKGNCLYHSESMLSVKWVAIAQRSFTDFSIFNHVPRASERLTERAAC